MKKRLNYLLALFSVSASILMAGCGSSVEDVDNPGTLLNTVNSGTPTAAAEIVFSHAAQLDRSTNSELYDNITDLISAAHQVWFDIESGGDLDLNTKAELEDDIDEEHGLQETRFLVTNEKMQSIEAIIEYAQTVYDEKYVEDKLLWVINFLYREADGKVYKSNVDGVYMGYLPEELQVWECAVYGEQATRYYATVPLSSDDDEQYYKLFVLRVCEEKEYQFEIMDEIIFK